MLESCELKGIQSYIVTTRDILSRSVFEIKNVSDTISDRLGVSDPGKLCRTCNSDISRCPGHMGHIKLKVPVPKIFLVKYLMKFINIVCIYCLKFKNKNTKVYQDITLDKWLTSFVINNKRNVVCERCGLITPVFIHTKNKVIEARFYHLKDKNVKYDHVKPISPHTLVRIFSNLHPEVNETCLKRGLDPLSFFWIYLPIPSINTRPNHKFINISKDKRDGSRDWTRFIKEIVRTNIQVGKVFDESKNDLNIVVHIPLNSTKKTIENLNTNILGESWYNIYGIISAFHSSKHKNILQKKMKYGSLQTNVEDRFRHQKTGRLRQNIVARRVNQAFRCVLEGHIEYPINIAIIPKKIAMQLSKKIIMNNMNLNVVSSYILNGCDKYPGANFVILKDGSEINLKHIKFRNRIDLSKVKYVRRHLIDDDIVMINRQPTLHRSSMLSFKIRLHNHNTVRLHYSVFLPLGADCDGDEVTGHIPQDIESVCEMECLMNVHDMIYNNNKVWIKFSENTLLGSSILSDNYRYDRDTIINILLSTDINILYHECDSMTGLEIFSLLLPCDFNMKLYREDTPSLIVKNGCIVSGQLNSSSINGEGGIIQCMYKRYNENLNIVGKFIYNAFIIMQNVVNITGLTCSYRDCILNIDNINKKNETRKLKSYLNTCNDNDNISNILTHVQMTASLHDDKLNKHIADERESNGMARMIYSGSKGSTNTIRQMTYSIGQMYTGVKRSLQHTSYHPNKKLCKPLHHYGYIENSYVTGVTIPDYMIESISTNENVITKNKGTAVSGYTVRKMSNALLSIKINHNKQAVDCNDNIIWWTYGNDGYTSDKLVKVKYDKRVINVPINVQELIYSISVNEELCTIGYEEFILLKCQFIETCVKNGLMEDSPCIIKEYLENTIVYNSCKHMNLSNFTKFLTMIRKSLTSSNACYGEAVGIVAAQSLGEPFTQISLKTPHMSGNCNEKNTNGRTLSSFVDCNFSDSNAFVHFVKSMNVLDATLFGTRLVGCKIKDILDSYKIINKELIVITLRKENMVSRCAFPDDIINAIYNNFRESVSNVYMDSIKDNSMTLSIYTKVKPMEHERLLNNILSVKIHGSYHIKDFWIDEDFNNRGELVLITIGTDLSYIINHINVDVLRTWSSDISEMERIYGVLTARNCLIGVLNKCMSTNNCRHIGLLARFMTYNGSLRRLRVSDVKEHLPATQRASYEFGIRQMIQNCIDGTIDTGKTITGAALCNKPFYVGTGCVNIIREREITSYKHTHQKCNLIARVVDLSSISCLMFFITHDFEAYIYIKLETGYYKIWNSYKHLKNPIFKGTVIMADIKLQNVNNLIIDVMDCFLCCSIDTKTSPYDFRMCLIRHVLLDIYKVKEIFKEPGMFENTKFNISDLFDINDLKTNCKGVLNEGVRFFDSMNGSNHMSECKPSLIWNTDTRYLRDYISTSLATQSI